MGCVLLLTGTVSEVITIMEGVITSEIHAVEKKAHTHTISHITSKY